MATRARSERSRDAAPPHRTAAPHPASAEVGLAARASTTQPFEAVRPAAAGGAPARPGRIRMLNGILADAMFLHALYKKHHWLVTGPTFIELHRLFDTHATEQLRIIDLVAERVQALGGIAVGDPRHAAELTILERPPDGAEPAPAMLDRLIDAHDRVIARVRQSIRESALTDDWGTNDLLVGDVLRVNERQAWFIAVQRAADWDAVATAEIDREGDPSAVVRASGEVGRS